jgi:hypothetical protein
MGLRWHVTWLSWSGYRLVAFSRISERKGDEQRDNSPTSAGWILFRCVHLVSAPDKVASALTMMSSASHYPPDPSRIEPHPLPSASTYADG